MRLASSDQCTLARIESGLRKSDPKLAGMLAVFSHLSRHECGSEWEQLSAWRPRLSRVIGTLLMAVAICLFLVCKIVLRDDRRMGTAVPRTQSWLTTYWAHSRGAGQRPSVSDREL